MGAPLPKWLPCLFFAPTYPAAPTRTTRMHRPHRPQHRPLPPVQYYVIVTSSTVGYGDVNAHTGAGRVVTCVIIIAITIIVPMKVSELIELMQVGSSYRRGT